LIKATPIVVLLLLCAANAAAFEQKIITRYSADDRAVPSAVRETAHPAAFESTETTPVADMRVYAKGDHGVLWLGSENGAARFDPYANHPWDRWQYFWGKRWLADNAIENIWVDSSAPHETVWFRTASGVNRLEWRPMRLEDKAAHFDEMVETRHLRHDFVGGVGLKAPGDLSAGITHDNDNDGLWTAMYLVAQVYRYAATKDPDARYKARRSLDTLIRLEEINPMDGFYARSYVSMDEPRPKGGEWHPTDDGKWLWKADTSSDETVGHYYGYALYYDLVANEEEKDIIRRKIRQITDRMIRDDYLLLDLDGKPTRWGMWNEEYYTTPEGEYEKALRSMELLSFLKTSYHITGDAKYQTAYWDRVAKGYANYTLDYRRWTSDEQEINYSDDELYYLSVLPLMLYETDPDLRAIYLDNITFTWGENAPEMNALWNYISVAAGAITMNPRIQEESRRTLERSPWEAIEWRVENSHRLDLVLRPEPDRHGQRETIRVIPPDERRIHKHNSSPFQPDGGGNGASEEAPTYWLLPYWMGRYYGWIE
jgi:hypothetical protein